VLGEPSPPRHDGGAGATQLRFGGAVAQPVGGQQDDAAALDQSLRCRQLADRLLKVLALVVRQDNRHGTWTRHDHLPE